MMSQVKAQLEAVGKVVKWHLRHVTTLKQGSEQLSNN